MAKRILVIEHPAQSGFFFSVEGGALTVGDNPVQAASMRNLRVLRIRCEVEVEDDVLDLTTPGAGEAPVQLRPGEGLQVGHAQLRLGATEAEKPGEAPLAGEAPS